MEEMLRKINYASSVMRKTRMTYEKAKREFANDIVHCLKVLNRFKTEAIKCIESFKDDSDAQRIFSYVDKLFDNEEQ